MNKRLRTKQIRFLGLSLLSTACSLQSIVVFAQEVEDIKDIHPPVDYPVNWSIWLMIALILVMMIISFLILKKVRCRKQTIVVDLPKPAWEIALEELRLFKEKDYQGKLLVKPFYTELSLILRRYIENRFLINAPDMTTEEFLESLKYAEALNMSQQARLQEFLTSCDMVKFAKYGASIDEMNKSLTLVEKFVEETTIEGAHEHKAT